MQQSGGDDKPPPAELIRTVRQVERRYSFVKTVHSLQELDDFRFENGCSFANVKKNVKFEKISLDCKKSGRHGHHCTQCPFTLLAWRRPTRVAVVFGEGGDEENELLLPTTTLHVYAHGNHNHQLKPTDERSAHRVQEGGRHLMPDAFEPAPSFATPDGQEWTFLETVEHLAHQLDKLKRKYHCDSGKLRELERQKGCCTKRVRCANTKCPFKLLIRNTDRGRSHLYSTGKHTCGHKKRAFAKHISLSLTHEEIEKIDKKNRRKQEKEVQKSPPAVLIRVGKNNVKYLYSYLKTVHSLQELNAVRVEHHCTVHGLISSNSQNVRLPCCRMPQGKKCPFALFVWLPKQTTNSCEKMHVYYTAHNEHNHTVVPAEEDGVHCVSYTLPLSDVHPPARIVTLSGRKWTFMETEEAEEENLANQLKEWKRRFHCFDTRTVNKEDPEKKKKLFQCRLTLNCTAAQKSGCRFAMLIQKTDRGRFHLYWSGYNHTCLHAAGNMRKMTKNIVLSDANPPASLTTTNNGRQRQWTFVESLESSVNLLDQRGAIKRRYHCTHRNPLALRLETRYVCRATFHCTTGKFSNCLFQMMAQKTDRGDRYHLYASGKHNCLHVENVNTKLLANKNMRPEEYDEEKEEEEEEDEKYDKEEEVDEDEEEMEDEEEDEDGLNDSEDDDQLENEELDDDEEEEEKENDEYEEGEDDFEEKDGEQEKVDEEEKEDGGNDDVGDAEIAPMENSARIRSSTLPHEFQLVVVEEEEEDDVQFIDFVDHPKSEGVKMRRLGEPKKELAGADAPVITMDEEELTNINRRMKMPKREMMKEEEGSAEEDHQPGPSSRGGEQGQRQHRAMPINGQIVSLAAINRQNQQQPVVATRVRWWAEPTAGHRLAVMAPNNEQQRLLRERKRRVNYRE